MGSVSYRPKVGDYVESTSGYRGYVIGPIRDDPNHVWVGTPLTSMGYYAHELRPVSKPGMSDTTVILLIAVGAILAIIFFVLWLRDSDRHGSRLNGGVVVYEIADTVADAIIIDSLDD